MIFLERIINHFFRYNYITRHSEKILLFCLKKPLSFVLRPLIKRYVFDKFCIEPNSIEESSKNIIDVRIGNNNNKLNIAGLIFDLVYERIQKDGSIVSLYKDTIQKIKNYPNTFLALRLSPFFVNSTQNYNSVNNEYDENFELSLNNFNTICRAALEHKVKLTIDAELYNSRNLMQSLTFKLMKEYNHSDYNVYITIQMYFRDSLKNLEYCIRKSIKDNSRLAVKLVRGAYMISDDHFLTSNKYQCDIQYNEAARILTKKHKSCSFIAGTHNLHSILSIIKSPLFNSTNVLIAYLKGFEKIIESINTDKDLSIYCYIPFGPLEEALPYLSRRLQENNVFKS